MAAKTFVFGCVAFIAMVATGDCQLNNMGQLNPGGLFSMWQLPRAPLRQQGPTFQIPQIPQLGQLTNTNTNSNAANRSEVDDQAKHESDQKNSISIPTNYMQGLNIPQPQQITDYAQQAQNGQFLPNNNLNLNQFAQAPALPAFTQTFQALQPISNNFPALNTNFNNNNNNNNSNDKQSLPVAFQTLNSFSGQSAQPAKPQTSNSATNLLNSVMNFSPFRNGMMG